MHDGETWGALSGLHTSWPDFLGAFDPSKNAWNQSGYVFVRSACAEGLFRNVTGKCEGWCDLVIKLMYILCTLYRGGYVYCITSG